MTNLSDLTRREQVLEKLKSRPGEWINGVDLANEAVGGSEGLKRLRELRDEGWRIQKRQSPVQGSDQYQYRLPVEFVNGGLAYYDPTRHPEARHEPRAPRPQRDPAARPSQSTWMDPIAADPKRDTFDHDWKPAKKAPGTLEHEFWIAKKQRAIGAVGDLGGGRWGWGVLIPASRVRGTPIQHPGHGVEVSKKDAILAVEAVIRRLRSEREQADHPA